VAQLSTPTHGASPAMREVSLDDKYTATNGTVFITGVQALVRLTLDQRRLDRQRGLDTSVFVSGYEGSPLGGVDLEFSRAARTVGLSGVVFRPGLNEELAATAVAGTQLLDRLPGRRVSGVTGFWYGKNPGLDRAADAIRHGNMAGTAPLGGAVAWVGDDPNCKSSTIPSSCEPMMRSLMVPLLAPATVADILTFGLHAVALSRACGLWTAMKIVADIADGSATVDVSDLGFAIPPPEADRRFISPLLLGSPSLDVERDLIDERLGIALAYARETHLNRVVLDSPKARIGIIAAGLSYAAVMGALKSLGLDHGNHEAAGLRVMKIGMPWPLDHAQLARFADGLEKVIVVEDKAPFLETELKAALYGHDRPPAVYGKTTPEGEKFLPAHGVIDADRVARAICDQLPGIRHLEPAAIGRSSGSLEGRRLPLHVSSGLDGGSDMLIAVYAMKWGLDLATSG
jgi:indolepyruvate ferredoxin oxidoreductase